MLDHVVLFAIGLCILYCAGRFLRPVGDFYVFVFSATGNICRAVKPWLERFSASPLSAQSKHPGLAVIARLVGLVVGVMVVAGEFVSSYAAISTLFGKDIAAPRLPPGLVGPALAVLIFAMCAVFGIGMLEAAEWVPPEVRIFDVPQGKRKAFQWFSACALGASVVAMALFYAERAFYVLDSTGDITVAFQIATFVLLGPLAGVASLVAFWMVILGLQALVQLVLTIVSCAATVLGAVAEVSGEHFRRPGVRGSEQGDVTPAPLAEKGEASMNQQCVGVYSGGNSGARMYSFMPPALKRLHADHLVGSSGGVNVDRRVDWVSVGRDVSPSRAEQERIQAGAVNAEQGYTEIFNRLGAAVFDANLPLSSIGSSLWFFLDGEILPFAVEMLRGVKRQLPYRAIAVVTQIDNSDRHSETTRNGLRALRELWQEGVIATTFVVSTRSAFEMTFKQSGGETKQMEFMAQTLTALLLAETESSLNRSCVEILRFLGRLSPFVGCAFASQRLSPLRLTAFRATLHWLRHDEQVVGDREDFRLQAEHVARQVLTEPEYQASPEGIRSDRYALLVCTVPLRGRDRRFGATHEALMTFLGRSFPWVGSVMVRGNGVPMGVARDPLDRFYVQASCVYPLSPDFFEDGVGELDSARGQRALPEAPTEDLAADSPAGRLPASNGAVTRRV